MKKLAAIVAVAALSVGLFAGCSSADAPTASTPSATAASAVKVPSLVGKDGAKARDALTAAGLIYEFDAGDDTVIIASNWNVTAQSPKAGSSVATGSTVTLTVVKPEATTAPTSDSTDETKSGLSSGYAMTACDAEGDAEFPYGFKGHWIIDGKKTMLGDTWVLVAGGTVTNAYNAKRDVTLTCVVTGSDEAPEVTRFSAE